MGYENICLIDTEQSASLYSKDFDFQVADIKLDDYKNQQKKFVKDFCDTFEAAIFEAKADCVIIDSLTHLWDAVKEYVNTLGGKYTDWAKGTPLWKSIIKMILSSPVPVIICSRAAYQDEVEAVERNGKTTYQVKRLGTKADVKGTADYEFTTVFSVDMDHKFRATKDRTGLFGSTMGEDGEPRPLDESVGRELKAWMGDGDLEVEDFAKAEIKEPESKVEQAKKKVRKSTPVADDSWKAMANQYIDAISGVESHEDSIKLLESVEEFLAGEKSMPAESKDRLRTMATDKVTELEAPF